MPLALPLLVSFAEVAGITIGAVATAAGIDLLSEKVESYMEENPEQSQKILAMIMPGQGLAQVFQNKSDKGDEEISETEIEVEEKPKKLSGKEKGERIKAAIKRARAGRGNYSSPDAEGSAVDIRGSVIREVEDMGIADKDLKDKYDPNKPKFNWRRFTKKNYAYGGGVGHLMEPSQTYHQYHDFTAPMTVGAMVDNMYNRGGRVNSPKSKNIKGQNHMLAYITPNEAKKLEALGGKETMTKEGIPAYPEWDSMYGASSKADFDKGKAPKGNVNWSGGNGGNNNSPKSNLIDKNPTLVKDTLTNAAINLGAKELGLGHLVHPAFLLKGAYDYFKKPEIKEEDLILGPTSEVITDEVITDYPSNNLLAFEPGSKKDKKIKSLHKERGLTKDLGIPFPQKKETQYQELLQEDQEQTDFPKSELLTAADGGRVGMFMGGDPLTGQALAIYNSMNDYGFSDQEIADALQTQGLYTPPGSGTPTPDPTPTPTPGQGGGQGGGGGGEIMELQKTYSTLPGDPKNYQLSQLEGTSDYFPPTTKMGKIGNFFNELGSKKVKGTLGDRLQKQSQGIMSKIPIPGSWLGKLRSPFNANSPTYNAALPMQLNFLEGITGSKIGGTSKDGLTITEGLDMIGRDPSSGHLKYGPGSVLAGKNVISGFGSNDYETALNKYISRMLRYENPTKFQAAKLQKARDELAAYKKQQEEKDIIDQKENLANATAIQKATIAARGREGGSGGRMVDRRTGAMKGYEQGAGGGKDAASEHFYIKDGGIAQYAPKKKGIASMFTRKR